MTKREQANEAMQRKFTQAQFAELTKQIIEEKNPEKRNELIENLQLLMDYVAAPYSLNREDQKVLKKIASSTIASSTIASMTTSSDPEKIADAAKFAQFLNQRIMDNPSSLKAITSDSSKMAVVGNSGASSEMDKSDSIGFTPREHVSTTFLTFLALASDLYAPKDFSPQPELPAGGIAMNRGAIKGLAQQGQEFMQEGADNEVTKTTPIQEQMRQALIAEERKQAKKQQVPGSSVAKNQVSQHLGGNGQHNTQFTRR
jgi:hypothetical protein